MADQDLIDMFRVKLCNVGKKGKHARQFTREDEERICRALAIVLENPSISATMLFELITGERA